MRRRFVSGRREFAFISGGVHRAILREQESVPVAVAEDERRTWWMFRGRFFWEDDGLEADEVMALVHERERRLRRRIERAKDMMLAEGEAPGPRREGIPEDVRREVFRRDGGRCAVCGDDALLQFDHVIPVALGGASSPENLQLLCAPCNREKGADLS
ncbi:MAG: HNH endonuclease [Thermoleophilia bacterium]|nr:HNH endonuclease [Thermoleophilia bacterium]